MTPASASGRKPTIAILVRWVGFEMGVVPHVLLSVTRKRRPVRARDAVVWGARTLLGRSYPVIGRVLRRDHSTMITAFRRAEQRRERDPAFARLTRRMAATFGEAA